MTLTIQKSKDHASTFQKSIYSIVRQIPLGQTLTYKQVATLAGNPKASRAVGNILNKNYNPEIPCHRVIRSDGKTGGYNRGSIRKKELLMQEKLKANSATSPATCSDRSIGEQGHCSEKSQTPKLLLQPPTLPILQSSSRISAYESRTGNHRQKSAQDLQTRHLRP